MEVKVISKSGKGGNWAVTRSHLDKRASIIVTNARSNFDLLAWKLTCNNENNAVVFGFLDKSKNTLLYVQTPESGSGRLTLTDLGADPEHIIDPCSDRRVMKRVPIPGKNNRYGLRPANDETRWICVNSTYRYAEVIETTSSYAHIWNVEQ